MITSPANPKVKRLVRLRSRRHRDSEGAFLIEGYRELTRAVAAGVRIDEIYVCEGLFLGTNEPELVDRIVASGARRHRLAPIRSARPPTGTGPRGSWPWRPSSTPGWSGSGSGPTRSCW